MKAASPSSVRLSWRYTTIAIFRAGKRGSCGVASYTRTRRAGSGYGSGDSSTPSSRLKIVTVAPIPIAERQQRNEAEAGILAEHPDRVGGVLAQLIEPRQAALIAEGFRRRVDAAEPAARQPRASSGDATAIAFQLLLHVEMERQLVA